MQEINRGIQPDTDLWKLASFLYFKGSVYKQDMLLYGARLTGDSDFRPSKLLKQLKDREIIELKDFAIGYRSQKRVTSVCFLTEKGQVILKGYYKRLIDIKVFDRIAAEFRRKKYKSLLELYNANHLKAVFNSVGIQTDVVSKPSIEQLYCYLNDIPFTADSESFYPVLSAERMERMYREGIFYTAREYKEFYINKLKPGEPLSSIFRGVYISKDRCLVIYSNGKNNPNMIYLPNETSEHMLINSLIAAGFADDNVAALTISDTNYFIYGT
ncbi:MAG: hypothetical protein IKE77_08320, partial [Erysipelotrichaceae bacterium]|nr:hypothetical protein [Erysipelotrichaceae bacterium]